MDMDHSYTLCDTLQHRRTRPAIHLFEMENAVTMPTYRHFVAAGAASAIASGTFNPLDCLRVRWQVASSVSSGHRGGPSLVQFGARIIQEEGLWKGLWRPGVGANMLGMSMASSLRFGYYETVRNALTNTNDSSDEGSGKEGWHMVVAGLSCGATAYFVTTPFHLIKTRLQAEAPKPFADNLMQGIWKIVTQNGTFSSLYKGSVPLAIRGSLFTAGQMVGYDGLKTIAKEQGYEDGPWLHAMSSVSSAFFASFLSAPADFVMAKYMNSTNQTLATCIQNIYLEGGIPAFWKGWSVFFIRLTPVLFLYSSVYEQLRYQMGLGYLN